MEMEPPDPEAATHNREPPLQGEGGEQGGASDRISRLPDDILGDIISLLPTKDGARTQILASRWRHMWRSAPLNLDHHLLSKEENDLDAVVSHVLTTHPGPGRRLCVPVYHLHGDEAATAEAWLRSPALDNLQELELCGTGYRLPYPPPSPPQPPPVAAFRFSDTLSLATFADCHLPDTTTQAIHLPKLKKLGLERVSISESALHNMIAGCPTLGSLLIMKSYGFCCLIINSISLTSIGVQGSDRQGGIRFEELIIESAPCLERLLQLKSRHPHMLVISAPKLETLGFLSYVPSNKFTLGSIVIQGSRVDSLMSAVGTVKILSIDMYALSLDAVIDLMRCFPCLEKLYIESNGSEKSNFWHDKHQDLIRSFDIRLKIIAWRHYGGTRSDVDFATFFLLNARFLELMTFQIHSQDYNKKFFAKQHKMLQMDRKVSRGASIHFTTDWSHRYDMFFDVHDLDLADPFERKNAKKPNLFFDLSELY